MEGAVHRLPAVERQQAADNLAVDRRFAADDTGLLDALPIAAAIIERDDEGRLRVAAHNSRFFDTVAQSSCTATDWDQADCLQSGPIAELLQNYFDGTDVAGDLDFRDGDGLSARYFRVKLAP